MNLTSSALLLLFLWMQGCTTSPIEAKPANTVQMIKLENGVSAELTFNLLNEIETRWVKEANTLLANLHEISKAHKNMNNSLKNKEEDVTDQYKKQFSGILRASLSNWTKNTPHTFYVENEPELRRRIEKHIDDLKDSDLRKCFNSKFEYQLNTCPHQVDRFCNGYEFRNGNLVVIALDNDLNEREIIITTEDDFREYFTKTLGLGPTFDLEFNTRTYAFCKLAAVNKVEHESFNILMPNLTNPQKNHPDWTNDPSTSSVVYFLKSRVSLDPKLFKDSCLKNNLLLLPQKLDRIFEKMDKSSANYLKFYKENLKENLKLCRKATQSTCAQTEKIRDKMILSYVTQGCKVRHVTNQDIQSDVSNMSDAEATHHLLLQDWIETCQAAEDQGYTWYHEEPSPRKGCKTQ